jgi:hypothetical protein
VKGLAAWLALALLAGSACAGSRSPSALSAEPSASFLPWAASVEASGSGSRGRIRLRGLLALAAPDRLRLEIPGLPGGGSLLLVADGTGLSALLASERIHYRGGEAASLAERVLGLSLDLSDLPLLLRGAREDLSGGCQGRVSRWREIGPVEPLPTLIRIRCPQGRLKLRLSGIVPVPPERVESAFEHPAPPEGFRSVDSRELATALERLIASGG